MNYRLLLFTRGALILSLALAVWPARPAIMRTVTPLGDLQALTGPTIRDVTTNQSEYPGGQVPRYAKFEITFQVDTDAENPQMPYDPAPPPGIAPGQGVSVDALFTPDNWATTYRQPAFYFQEYDHQLKNGQEWFYPTGAYSWKVRFAPNQVGNWQYKLVAEDASGRTETAPAAFTVTPSDSHGFVRVSQRDRRYFEFEDGTYFPALGYNMNYDHISWVNPVEANRAHFQIMGQNGIQLVRMWLSEWGIYGSAWNPWNSTDPALNGRYIPYEGLTTEITYPGSTASMRVSATRPCMFIGWKSGRPAVKRGVDYRIRIRYRTGEISGPRVGGQSYGLVAKVGGWLTNCGEPGSGTAVTPYVSTATNDWQILEGRWNSGSADFLPYFYLVMENASGGSAWIDRVWIEEDLGNGSFGANIVSKPWMSQDLYMEQRNSFAFDQVLKLAEQNGVYLRPVVHEKNEFLGQRFDFNGQRIPDDPACFDADPGNDPVQCPGNDWFYGNWRQVTRTRWLQQAWWRYLQARWGYSTAIHSWELLNEGDPASGRHFTMADEFGRYMHQFAPNDHLVSTSNWHSFPRDAFWANAGFPYVDFADIHLYVEESSPDFADPAAVTVNLSMQRGAYQPGGAGKPVIRGETGFTVSGTEPGTAQLDADTRGVWLHQFIWGGINPGGLIESYWYENYHIYRQGQNGSYIFDHRDEFGAYYNFIRTIPLNNGLYQDAAAQVSDTRLRALGQKDLTNRRAHLWIQNTEHTWQRAAAGISAPEITGTVTVGGLRAGEEYVVEWWNPYPSTTPILSTQRVTASAAGDLVLTVTALRTDVAVKIYPAESQPGLTATPTVRPTHTPTVQLSSTPTPRRFTPSPTPRSTSTPYTAPTGAPTIRPTSTPAAGQVTLFLPMIGGNL